jgi:hypothetical protein
LIAGLEEIMLLLRLYKQQEVEMFGRRVFAVAATLTVAVLASSAYSAEKTDWNGVWIGDFGNNSRISVTVLDNRVTKYSYRGQPLDVGYNKLADDTLSFGDGYNYAMSLKRTGGNTAKATYHGRHGFVTASLKRQPALVSISSH